MQRIDIDLLCLDNNYHTSNYIIYLKLGDNLTGIGEDRLRLVDIGSVKIIKRNHSLKKNPEKINKYVLMDHLSLKTSEKRHTSGKQW